MSNTLEKINAATTSALAGKQPLDADLTAIAALTPTTDNFMQAKSSSWASRTIAQVVSDLQAVAWNFSQNISFSGSGSEVHNGTITTPNRTASSPVSGEVLNREQAIMEAGLYPSFSFNKLSTGWAAGTGTPGTGMSITTTNGTIAHGTTAGSTCQVMDYEAFSVGGQDSQQYSATSPFALVLSLRGAVATITNPVWTIIKVGVDGTRTGDNLANNGFGVKIEAISTTSTTVTLQVYGSSTLFTSPITLTGITSLTTIQVKVWGYGNGTVYMSVNGTTVSLTGLAAFSGRIMTWGVYNGGNTAAYNLFLARCTLWFAT